MPEPLIWLTEQDVVSLIGMEDAVAALESGLRTLGAGDGFNVPKALATWSDGSSMHSLGSGFPELGLVGFKNWVHTRRGATALFNLFDAHNGSLLAVMEAAALGQLRTSAMSGVATKWLAAPDADAMALIGTGAQAVTQIAAVNAVRPLKRLNVFSPTPEKRRAFADLVRDSVDFEVVECASAAEASDGMPIVTLVTRAVEPFFTADMLAPGAHLNAVGAILPHSGEFTQDVFGRASVLVTDDLPNLQRASREFIEHFGAAGDWSSVRRLSDLIAQGWTRPENCDVTLFKAMGMGISDLSMAIVALERAREQGTGTGITHPLRAKPRWTARSVA